MCVDGHGTGDISLHEYSLDKSVWTQKLCYLFADSLVGPAAVLCYGTTGLHPLALGLLTV